MENEELVSWLLEGDVSIQYQVYRDLLTTDRSDLQERIACEGWGSKFLSKRKSNGHWGKRFYEPKWISSHYTLLDLKNLNLTPDHEEIKETIDLILETEKGADGGVGAFGAKKKCDVCVNGMFLNYASYFRAAQEKIKSVVDFLLAERMPDGGFNCRSNRSKAVHSSFHSTISVLEGITEYLYNGYKYRKDEILKAKETCVEFLLLHQLFLSDKTGDVINKDFLRLAYPGRWRYDILRALDCLQYAHIEWDNRMMPAIEVLKEKRRKNGTWNVQAKYPGQVHFDMEKAGRPSRWNTLRVLRVFKHYEIT